jgi:hypothetical protein
VTNMADNVPTAPTQCPECKGTGKLNGQDCGVCFGSGEQLSPGAIEEGAPIGPPVSAPESMPGDFPKSVGHWDPSGEGEQN